jgi:hypothetical protein
MADGPYSAALVKFVSNKETPYLVHKQYERKGGLFAV